MYLSLAQSKIRGLELSLACLSSPCQTRCTTISVLRNAATNLSKHSRKGQGLGYRFDQEVDTPELLLLTYKCDSDLAAQMSRLLKCSNDLISTLRIEIARATLSLNRLYSLEY